MIQSSNFFSCKIHFPTNIPIIMLKVLAVLEFNQTKTRAITHTQEFINLFFPEGHQLQKTRWHTLFYLSTLPHTNSKSTEFILQHLTITVISIQIL